MLDSKELLALMEIMDKHEIPSTGRKLLLKDGALIMDERPPVFRPIPVRRGGPRIYKHRKAKKQRHK